jgi:alcohol dehydrogenase class IV
MNIFKGAKKVLLGNGQLPGVLVNAKKVFVVCDPFLLEGKKYSYVSDVLDELNIDYDVYGDVAPDPDIDLVTRGIEALVKSQPDTIISFGGGSAIDACKAMVFFAMKNQLLEKPLMIAIPTTSGTGSEVTDFSVITDKEKGVKYPLIDDSMLPDVAVIDAQLTLTVPPEITAATGMDVLTHAIEAMVSKNATDFSDASAEKAIKLVRSNLLKVYREPNNFEARQAMHNASCLAGVAFNNAGLGLNHSMAHALGGRFHVAHGKANAILLPYVMGFNAGCFDQLNENAAKYARIARLIKVDSESIRTSALNLIRTVKKTNDSLNIPRCLMDLGIDQEEFAEALPEMAEAAFKDRCLPTNPREVTLEDIKELYVHCYFGKVGKKL